MRRSVTAGRFARTFVALLFLVLGFRPAAAQIIFDGNLIFNNNNLVYPSGQYTGTCLSCANAPACDDSTAFIIGTVKYLRNFYLNPLLPNAAADGGAGNIAHPVFQPQAGSPAFVGNDPNVVTLNPNPGDSFFEPVTFAGAIGPDPDADWTQGWTYYDSNGAGRDDLHLPGMTDPRPLVTYANISYASNDSVVWSADSNYLVVGFLRVKNGSSLTVPAGTVIFGSTTAGQQGTIIAERGGKLYFLGTKAKPIIATSDAPPGSQVRGGWGGIWMLGRAVCNCANTVAGDSCASEGGAIGFFGGSNDHDNSGQLSYVRCEYSGYPISLDNELNSFTFDGVGDATQLDHLQAHRGDDDGLEFFGGVANVKYAIETDGNDDGYDWQMGFRGKAQFFICRQLGDGLQTDKGVEADNNEFDFNTANGPRSNPILSNFTMIGDRRTGGGFPGPQTAGVHLRRGTLGTIVNSIIFNWPHQALRVSDAATYRAACGLYTTLPTWAGPGTTAVGSTIARGTLFVNHYPNPFSSGLDVQFSLPTAADVQVDVFSADGRLVQRLASGRMAEGPHTVRWDAGHDVAAGVYFYRVQAGALQGRGRVVHVD